jgi:Domain of unknown function (DUF5069)
MTPLDLTLHPPRPCRAEIDGIIFLPRAIDKVRAALPGGKLGSYFSLASSTPTLSSMFYHRMGITHEELTTVVASAENDDEVAAWLRARVDGAAIEKLRSQLLGIRMGALPPQSRTVVNALYGAGAAASDDKLLVDLVDEDDAATFAHPQSAG